MTDTNERKPHRNWLKSKSLKLASAVKRLRDGFLPFVFVDKALVMSGLIVVAAATGLAL